MADMEIWNKIVEDFERFCANTARYYEVDRSELHSFLWALLEEAEMPQLEEQLALELIFGDGEE